MPPPEIRALVIVFDGIEEIEALTPVDLLRRAKIDVTVASVAADQTITGRNQISFLADATLAEVAAESFDLVVLPGGPGVLELMDEPRVKSVLLAQDQAGKALAAICAAPKVLARHRILDQRRATSHQSVRHELPQPSDEAVVEDQHITTSQGVGTAIAFSLALIRRLRGTETAQEVADSIHFAS